MDLTFILSAAIFTLLAIVVATSLLNGSSSSADSGHGVDGSGRGFDPSGPRLNGYVPENNTKKKKKKAEDDWCEISGSAHDHWDVVKSVLSEEAHPRPHTEELATASVEHSCSTSMSLETEGATESPEMNDKMKMNDGSFKYVPGKARSHHMETMMSKEELEEEQRVQREQLAAIFQLLKDNKETFGDVSEGDMEEQLRLYSI